jgi:hypothetical protein
MDQTSEVGQCQEDYHFIASPEVRCSPLSPKGDFLMTSQDETPALKSPPFVISPTIHTTNNDLFGASSNQQSKTGKYITLLYHLPRNFQTFSIPFMNILPEVRKMKAVFKTYDVFMELHWY